MAGQVGAWLQSRRDAAADERRHLAEIERLKLQIESTAEHAAREREYRDLLEWREKRLDTYGTIASTLNEAAQWAWAITESKSPANISSCSDDFKAARRSVEVPMDRCHLIGNEAVRQATLSLSVQLDKVDSALEDYSRLVSSVVKKSADGEARFEQYFAYRRSRRVGQTEQQSTDPDFVQLEEGAGAVFDAQIIFERALDDWQSAVRLEMGVPD